MPASSVAETPIGRFLVLVWLAPLIYLPGFDPVYRLFGETAPWYWWDISYIYYTYFLFSLALLLTFLVTRIDWKQLIGARPARQDMLPALKLTAFLFLFSAATAYALFWPLTYLVPEFVTWWFIETGDVIFYFDGTYPALPNLLALGAVVILAPVTEELLFRGLLLRRWAHKYGLVTGIVLSSVLFGAVHPDPIGAIAFGIGMCIITLRTRSLLLPMICHAANNFAVWCIAVMYEASEGPDYSYTLEQFRQEWYLGVAAGVIALVWAVHFIRHPAGLRQWRMPTF